MMDLIELVELNNNEYIIKYFGSDDLITLTNIDFPATVNLEFRNNNPLNRDKTFTALCNGNFIDDEGDTVAIIIVQSTDEGAHYMIKMDDFDDVFIRL
jgi:hypothetical protein